jgi:transposase-like protein
MKIERTHALNAEPYERSEARRGYANGYKPKTLDTRMGRITVNVPQVRGDLEFFPSALEKGCRSERALKVAIAEMYVKGISIRDIFNSPDRQEAEDRLRRYVEKYGQSALKLAEWMEQNIPEGFTVFILPKSHRRFMRTTNMLERLNEEIKRRTRVAGLFPNEPSLLRLVGALLMETDEDWQTGKKYLDMTVENDTPVLQQKRIYRKNVA